MNAVSTWQDTLAEEKQKPYFTAILEHINREKEAGTVIYPPSKDIFNAFRYTPLERVRVVILGQDPYHGLGQAHGLAFSVRPNIPFPPSLKNIFQEVHDDIGVPLASTGYLKPWADQGVFLLNAVLTVEHGKPQSHAGIGWERFTDSVIRVLSEKKEDVVFLLWGSYAQKKGSIIDFTKHTILEAPHPSPLSAHRGFFGCKHFSQTNQRLIEQMREPIDWGLS